MKVAWSARAVRELQLEEFPESGRMVSGVQDPMLREIVYRKSYRIVYRIGAFRILIVAVRNFAQQFDASEFAIK